MHTYITLLRGINVGGNKKIKMEDLRQYCESIGARDVATYIQSGNIVFRHPQSDLREIAQSITREIEKRSGFSAWVVVFPLDYWQKVIEEFPFNHIEDLNPSRTLLVFYEQPLTPEHQQIMHSIDLKNDLYEVREKVAYIYCTDGISNSPLADATLQKKIKVENTSRNWRTVLKLDEMACQIS
ncbi:MAG: DUF1697 domain-containing protein [Lewinellaceae bacterium]|nr:DUF1697 domain-containing protein [Lewinellaceae bacterium]